MSAFKPLEIEVHVVINAGIDGDAHHEVGTLDLTLPVRTTTHLEVQSDLRQKVAGVTIDTADFEHRLRAAAEAFERAFHATRG